MRRTATVLLGCVLILLTLGIVMLASTSGVRAGQLFGDPLFYVKRQLLWLLVGGVAAVICSRLDYHMWKKVAFPLAIFCVLLLIMTLIPGVGLSIKGSRRWLRFGVFNLQPSELAKVTTVIMLAWWMARTRWHVKEFKHGLLIPLGGLGVILLLIFAEPDFGTTMLVAVVGMTMMYVAGTRFVYLAAAGLTGLIAFSFAVMKNAERMRRITAFLDPEKYAQDEAFQLMNALYAIVSGGVSGVGLGQSMQKLSYLPEAHTDFIFAILAEELGVIGSLSVILLFLTVFISGFRIALNASDEFGKLLAFGFTMMMTLQACINIGVVTGCLPTKGLALPFISFGGSSMAVNLAMVGILMNISRNTLTEEEVTEEVIKDRSHRF